MTHVTTLHLSREDDCSVLDFTLCQFQDMLRQCPVLEVLVLSGDLRIHRNAIPEPIEPVSLPYLRSFQLFVSGDTLSFEAALGSIDASRLEDLVYAKFRIVDMVRCSRLFNGMTLSSVKTMTLSPATSGDYLGLWMATSCFPNVEHLILPNLIGDQNTLDFMATQKVFWPGLRTLALRNIDPLAEDKVCRLVSALKRTGCALRTLYLDEKSMKSSFAGLKNEVEVVCADPWMARLRNFGIIGPDEDVAAADRFVGLAGLNACRRRESWILA
ncbi:hypothetical protein D9615_003058 [Tricholomella constricta]|uniref:Uncharacterized protein n=1 Tax=Tricholomella constricta TaxID=117010 RepID=A0A8H5HGA8_9AGAR|nr:hypothetical protein D9615_003058 [Tricholomella constricta]